MRSRPLVIDLFCGLGGWTRGFLAERWDAVGFDIERHEYAVPASLPDSQGGKGTKPIEGRGWTQGCAVVLGMEGANKQPCLDLKRYPAQLVLQDVLTLDGRQFKGIASMIVASPPCQEYSYMAMPWSRAKQIRAALLEDDPVLSPFPEGYTGSRTVEQLNALFNAALRIAREAELPIVIENVKGAQPWVGRAKANFGSYYLWGDVARIGNRVVRDCKPVFGMPAVQAAKSMKNSGGSWFGQRDGMALERNDPRDMRRNPDTGEWENAESRGGWNHPGKALDGAKNGGNGSWFGIGSPGQTQTGGNTVSGLKHGGDCLNDPAWPGKQGGAVKQPGLSGEKWFNEGAASKGSRSSARKAASAMIAEIPFELAAHVARVFRP